MHIQTHTHYLNITTIVLTLTVWVPFPLLHLKPEVHWSLTLRDTLLASWVLPSPTDSQTVFLVKEKVSSQVEMDISLWKPRLVELWNYCGVWCVHHTLQINIMIYILAQLWCVYLLHFALILSVSCLSFYGFSEEYWKIKGWSYHCFHKSQMCV